MCDGKSAVTAQDCMAGAGDLIRARGNIDGLFHAVPECKDM